MASKKLKFIGIGSCFNTRMYNTSAYYYNHDDSHLFLIDCGMMIFPKLRYTKLLNEAKSIDILITHLHDDHAGSLESLIYFCQYDKHIIPNVIYPDPEEMYNHLRRVDRDAYNVILPEDYSRYPMTTYEQKHRKDMKAYGYSITLGKKTIFYSGDAQNIPHAIMELFNTGHITHLYQDVTKIEKSVHMHINNLAELIPPEQRKHVTCMHFDDSEALGMARTLGFKVARRVDLNREFPN